MDCIGLNGVFIGAKAIPFNKSSATLDKDITHYIALISFLKKHYKKDSDLNNFYLIANEPAEVQSQEHKIWETHTKNPFFKLIQSDEVNQIAHKVEETGAKMFLN